ncbi:putative bacteriophage-related protein [Magnetococcus marinus MC-1]|uniref:Putative bacteriophage-related protein n=1 Tax=Magnetococcus marinus (strain ATCC BAA-1437 / JCM 17883 / MC-1) TaxID=156889 RepID=A0L6Z4_MAGMM|nr:hypothetical protein [Magnetococcus marinus]ABK43737.1 putative bacteriophage-related protein [Magnetococcus marinus MC-1]
MNAELSHDGKFITITIPGDFRKRGGRKRIEAPSEMNTAPKVLQRDETLAKLVAKAYRWMRELEAGKVDSIRMLAEREKLDNSYVTKVLRLTLLAPDIVETILNGKQPDEMTWKSLARPFPVEWEGQREQWKMK